MSDLLRRVSAARTYLTAKVPFLGFMVLRLRPRLASLYDGVETAGVGIDGTLVLNEEWCSKLSDAEMRGMLAHEVLHPALHFFERMGGRPLAGWNIAHDHAINLIILDFISGGLGANIQLPKGGLHDPKYKGMAAEEIYKSFPEEVKKGNMQVILQLLGMGDSGGVPGEGIGLDCRLDLTSTSDGRSAAAGDASAKERLGRDWQIQLTAAAQVHEQQKGQGSLPGGLRILIDEMNNPKIHWARVISQWLGEHAGKAELTYQRPSRRSESVGEILIGRRRRSYPEVTVLWDTSGSMNGEEKKIFPEIASMCEDLDLRLRVIIIDAAIHADLEDVKEAEEVAAALSGGGGSDFNPAFTRLDEERNDSVVIAFTDGYIGVPNVMPESLQGCVWVITTQGTDPTGGKWGQVMRLDGNDNGVWE